MKVQHEQYCCLDLVIERRSKIMLAQCIVVMIQKNLSLSFRSKKLIDDTQSHLKDIKEILKVCSYFMFEDQYTLGFVIYHVNLVRERA